MLDWLRELLRELWAELKPWVVIPHYDLGVRLRLGKFKFDGVKIYWWYRRYFPLFRLTGKILEPGLHWKIPFFDDILTVMVKPTTVDLTEQSITTRNGVELVVECSVKYEISDPEILLLEVHSAVDAIADMSKNIIRSVITTYDWPDLNTSPEFEKEVLRKIKVEAKRWGIRAVAFNVASLGKMRSIRLLQTNSWKHSEEK